ncbi:MAG: SDR family NAD(P)-dependent oxidoreductase [Burkholderiaceae bacterium]|nr:SDR family NAD(P)-dependent oxidoreductase [Burkholderiaceae bacterium]
MPSPQTPIHSGFGPRTIAREAIGGTNLTGKIAVVTGGYSGLGLETTRVLAGAGALVVVPARDPAKARAALAGIPRVECATMDLLEPDSIASFARSFIASNRPLHILVNNAGIATNPLTRDARGYESQFSANHLGHFQLTAQLLPALLKAGGARVVNTSSRGHSFSAVDFDDPNFEHRPYDKMLAYGQSKTANTLFAVALDRRGESHGIRAFAVHPGRILSTDLIRHLTPGERVAMLRAAGVLDENGNEVRDVNGKNIEQGAATIVWCAASAQLESMGGVYCADCDISPAVPADSKDYAGVRPWAIDPEQAEKLWILSEKLTGVRFRLD